MKKPHSIPLYLALTLALAGCATQGNIPTPTSEQALASAQIPKQWQTPSAPSGVNVNDSQKWWEAFNDSALNQLVEQALAKNSNLASAGYKLRQAQLSAGLTENQLFPSISANVGARSSRALDGSSSSAQSYSTGVTIAYTIDLWGKLSKANSIKQWEAQATEQDLRNTELSIEGAVVKQYWLLAYLNQQIASGNKSIDYAQQSLDLMRGKYKAGAVSNIEVLSAERSLASQESAQESLLQQRAVARNAMAILFDAPPSAHIANEPDALPTGAIASVAAGIPAEVLARRPDVRAAELRLREGLGGVDVARANFYPNFALTGTIGTGSTNLTQLLSDPVGTLALNLALPFLNWNENQLNLKISKVAYQQSIISYRQTLYGALQEVDNSLSAANQYAKQGDKQTIVYRNAKETERLYEIRYRAGGSSYKDWLDASETRRQAELSYLANRYNQLINQVDVRLALGG